MNKNRYLARERLRRRLDELINGQESEIALERKERSAKENQKTTRAKRRLAMKAAFKKSSSVEQEDK